MRQAQHAQPNNRHLRVNKPKWHNSNNKILTIPQFLSAYLSEGHSLFLEPFSVTKSLALWTGTLTLQKEKRKKFITNYFQLGARISNV